LEVGSVSRIADDGADRAIGERDLSAFREVSENLDTILAFEVICL
jgi:hypothetical protein